MSEKKERFIFVSHSGEDTWVAKQIAREIKACGGTPFLDEADVDIVDEFENEILDFLDKAHEMFVLITPWSLSRPYVLSEIGAAWVRRIPIVVALHGMTFADFKAQPHMPVFLKKRNVIRLNDVDKYLAELKGRIAKGGSDE